MNPDLRILIVDEHAIVREGLKRILEGQSLAWLVSEATTRSEALDLLRHGSFDLAIVDLSMPAMTGSELLKQLRQERPRLRLLALSMHAEDQFALHAFKAGAHGYVTKDVAVQDLVAAVQKVAAGGTYVTTDVAERLVLQLNGPLPVERHGHLSEREVEVMRRLVAGQRPTEIAQALQLSVKTVSTHKTRILRRLQLPSLAALVRYGLEHGLGVDQGPHEPQ